LSRMWVQKRKRDQFYRLAKRKGYRSRSAFKLLQASRKYGLIRRENHVVDLGAAPGGWLQVARELVGESGYVLGVDINPVEPLPWSNVQTVQGDIRDDLTVQSIVDRVGGKVDVVLSDVSPNISGVWEVDHASQIFLARRAFELAKRILNLGGNFLVKVFHGSELNEFKNEVKENFSFMKLVKPAASRSESSEIYILAKGFKQ